MHAYTYLAHAPMHTSAPSLTRAGTPFAERSVRAREATVTRWREGRAREHNQYQAAVASTVVEGERVPT